MRQVTSWLRISAVKTSALFFVLLIGLNNCEMMAKVFVLRFIPLLLGTYCETVMTCFTTTCSPSYYATCCHKKNIALGSQHTNQSSDYEDFDSNLAVDGNTNTDFANKTCTHTHESGERNASWMINLESTYNISEIKLYLRSDICDPGWYGEECDKQCNCRNSPDCDKTTGWCRDGCRAGKQGDGCQCECDEGRFGIKCLSTCGKCSGNQSCNKTDGTCRNGCIEHFVEPMCTECNNGRFGNNCLSICGNCFKNQNCDKTDGTCPNGCEEHYNPPMCTECEDGRYGENCGRNCGHCLEDLPCNKTTGECGNGCSSNFEPPLCYNCVKGQYGTDCQSVCGQCADNATCSRNGTCPRGCIPGFTDRLCQTLVDKDSPIQIAGGVSAAIVILIIVIIVGIVILKRRRLQKKPMMTVASGDENPKDTSFTNILDTPVTKQIEQQTHDDVKASSKSRGATRPEHKAKKYDTQTPASQKPDDIGVPVKEKLEVCSTETPSGGNEYYSVIPTPIPLTKLAQYIKDRINCVGFDNEFKLLPYGIHEDHNEGKKPENKKRNRFQELYPCKILSFFCYF